MALIKCPECGKLVSDKAATCPNCGFDVQKAFMPRLQYRYQPYSVTPAPVIETRRAPFGIVALILSIVSYILMMLDIILKVALIVFGFYASILGLVFSIIGLTIVKRNREAYTHKPMLVVSLVLSIVSILIGVYFFLLYYG